MCILTDSAILVRSGIFWSSARGAGFKPKWSFSGWFSWFLIAPVYFETVVLNLMVGLFNTVLHVAVTLKHNLLLLLI